jgi:plastocyanin/type II secretory pathway pseudopilin PulG
MKRKKLIIGLVITVFVLALLGAGAFWYYQRFVNFATAAKNTYKVAQEYNFNTEVFASDIPQITRIEITPNGQHMFVATLTGDIWIFTKKDGKFIKQQDKFYKVETNVVGFPAENGLTGLTFGADFATSGDVFVTYAFQNDKNELKNRVARLTLAKEGDNFIGKEFTQIFEGNVNTASAHQIQGGVGVMVNSKPHFMFPVGDGLAASSSHDLSKDAGKVMFIQRDGSNPEGERPYPENPKIQAVGIRNIYDLEPNSFDNNKIMFIDTANGKNDKLVYGNLFSKDGKNTQKLDMLWKGDDANQKLAIADLYTTGNPNMNLFQWEDTVTPMDIEFYPGGIGKIPSSNNSEVYFLLTVFGQTASTRNSPGKRIMLGKLTDLNTQPKVELKDFVLRNNAGQGFMGHPVTVAVDPLTKEIYFGDIVEGRVYRVFEADNSNPEIQEELDEEKAAAVVDMTDRSEVNIVIDRHLFLTPKIKIKKGTKVIWTNKELVPHTVTSTKDPKTLDSSIFGTGQKFEFTFNEAGTFDYYCILHPEMVGVVIVE